MTSATDLHNFVGPDGTIVHMPLEAVNNDYTEWQYWSEADKSGQRQYFRFRFEWAGSYYRIYILEQPNYGSRASNPIASHRIPDGDRHFICISTGSEPKTVAEAISWYAYWAEKTVKYIKSGGSFS